MKPWRTVSFKYHSLHVHMYSYIRKSQNDNVFENIMWPVLGNQNLKAFVWKVTMWLEACQRYSIIKEKARKNLSLITDRFLSLLWLWRPRKGLLKITSCLISRIILCLVLINMNFALVFPVHLFRTWASAPDKGKTSDAVFLDFEKAFDSVPHFHLTSKLR